MAILFGSRATGNFRDGESDIDIMLVQDEPPTPEQKKRACEAAQQLAAQRYKARTPIQILWQTHQNFDRMRRTVNHVVASAMTEGIILPRDRDEFKRRYGDNLASEEYEWTVTDQRIRNAESALRSFRVLHENNGDDRYPGKMVQEGLEHALKAVISAAGRKVPQDPRHCRAFGSGQPGSSGPGVSILHSSQRDKPVRRIRRLLRPGTAHHRH